MMLFAEPIEIEREQLERLIGPAVGFGAVLALFLIGMLVVSLRRRTAGAVPSAPPTGREKPKPAAPSSDDIFTHGSKNERRNALRRAGNPIAVLISDAEARSKPTGGYVLDRSTGGLCLSVPDQITTGTILSVRTTNAPESIPWVQVEVKSCRPTGGEFELGCQFVKTPPWSVMLLFG